MAGKGHRHERPRCDRRLLMTCCAIQSCWYTFTSDQLPQQMFVNPWGNFLGILCTYNSFSYRFLVFHWKQYFTWIRYLKLDTLDTVVQSIQKVAISHYVISTPGDQAFLNWLGRRKLLTTPTKAIWLGAGWVEQPVHVG